MPNRLLKESICVSGDIDKLSWTEEVFFYRLIVNCDDFGRMDARAAILKAKLFPLKDVTVKQIEAFLSKLVTVGMVRVYEYDRQPFLQLLAWEKHQQIRAKKSKYPAPDSLISSDINCNQLQADVTVIQSESESESNPKRARFAAPDVREVAEYCLERQNGIDAEAFVDFYASKGWLVGKTPMKDWRAAVRTWEKSRKEQGVANPKSRYEGVIL